MDAETAAALQYWKRHRYVEHQVPFVDAVHSLSTREPLVELQRVNAKKNEWLVCHTGSSRPAVMTYAGIFSEAEPYETGNLVWGNNDASPHLEESRITRFAGFKASYSYTLETYKDQEIWFLQKSLEEYVCAVPSFNPDGIPRLEWQNGQMVLWRFVLRTPMFIPYQSRGVHPQAPAGLHPWVQAAHAKSRSHRANPRRPRVRAIENGELLPISSCSINKLEYGDVVGLVFTVTYVLSAVNWQPVYHLSDVIRVMPANRETFPLQATEEAEDVPLDDDDFSIAYTPNAPTAQYATSTAPQPLNRLSAPRTLQPQLTMVNVGSYPTTLAPGGNRSAPPTDEAPPPYVPVGRADLDVEDDDASSITTDARGSSRTAEDPGESSNPVDREPSEPDDTSANPLKRKYVDDEGVHTTVAASTSAGRGRKSARGKHKP